MLKILVQWLIQHKILNHLSQCQLGVRLDLYKKCGSNSVLLRWQRSISDANCTFLSSFHASANSSFLFLTFVSCHTGIFSSCSHYVFHCSLCGTLNAWSIGISLCTGLWRLNEFISFPAMWSSWYLWGALGSFNNTSLFCFVFSNGAASFPATSAQWSFTRHRCWHRKFQLSTSTLHDFLKFLGFRINEVNTT